MGHLHTFKPNTNKLTKSTIKQNTNNQTKYKQSNKIQTNKKNTKTTKQTCKIYIDAMNE